MSFQSNYTYVAGLFENNFLAKFFILGLVLLATVLIAHLVNYVMERLVKKLLRVQTDFEMKKIKRTKLVVFRRLATIFIYIVGIGIVIAMVPGLRALSYSFLAGAGVLAIIIGFAVQKAMSNVFSGFFLAAYEPFRVGDKLRVEEEMGIVEDITLRHTIIKTFDSRRLVIPNSKMDDMIVTNYSLEQETIRWKIDMGISYDSSIDLARKIMLDEANKHKNVLIFQEFDEEGMVALRQPKVKVTQCGDFSVNMRLYFWAKDVITAKWMGYDLIESIKKRFDAEGIEIPYPCRTIIFKHDRRMKPKRRAYRTPKAQTSGISHAKKPAKANRMTKK